MTVSFRDVWYGIWPGSLILWYNKRRSTSTVGRQFVGQRFFENPFGSTVREVSTDRPFGSTVREVSTDGNH